MLKADVILGATYTAKISGSLVYVRLDRVYKSGWKAMNLATSHEVTIKSAAKLRRRVGESVEMIATITQHHERENVREVFEIADSYSDVAGLESQHDAPASDSTSATYEVTFTIKVQAVSPDHAVEQAQTIPFYDADSTRTTRLSPTPTIQRLHPREEIASHGHYYINKPLRNDRPHHWYRLDEAQFALLTSAIPREWFNDYFTRFAVVHVRNEDGASDRAYWFCASEDDLAFAFMPARFPLIGRVEG